MRRLLVAVRVVSVRVGFAVGRRLRGRRPIVLATAHANVPMGNLAAIEAELGRRGIPATRLAHRPSRSVAGRLADVWFHVRAGVTLARARVVVVDDYFFPLYVVHPRPGTLVVQVWHACGALKKFGWSVAGASFGAGSEVLERVPIHANYDICLVSSSAVTPFYADAFRQPADRFVSALGIPRTDVLASDEATRSRIAARVRARYGLAEGRRVVLYAPTFRGDRGDDPRSGVGLDLRALGAAIGEDHVLLLRLHPFVRSRVVVPEPLRGFVVDVSGHPDVNELMLASDVLVTDYSTTMFEFALLERPIVLFAPDLAAYERERGFYFDYRSAMPGPVFETTDPLAAFLRAGEFDLERVRAFARHWFDVADGHATERFVDRIVVPALAGRRVTATDLERPV